MSKTKTTEKWLLTSVALRDAYTDFMLSRQAMNCTPSTLAFYKFTVGKFLEWIEERGATKPEEVTARYVREYIAKLVSEGKKDTTVWDHARAINTMLFFWQGEGYTPTLIKFELPKLAKKRLPVLTAEQLREVIKSCNVRDKAIVLFRADSGLRRAETINLNWADLDMQSGLVRVKQSKGKKDRSAVIGARTRRALLVYRKTLADRDGVLFQSKNGERFTGSGILRVFQRLTRRTGIHVTPHALRRTFVILSLRNGMNPLHLQNLGGWTDLEMVQHYAQMVNEDLLQEHKAHSPIDNL